MPFPVPEQTAKRSPGRLLTDIWSSKMPKIPHARFRHFNKLVSSLTLLLMFSTLLGYSPSTDPSTQLSSRQRRNGTDSRAQYPSFASRIAPGDISLRMSDEYMPVLGVWVWDKDNLAPEGFQKPIEQAALHSPFNLLITFLRFPDKEVVDADVHDQVKLAAEYGITNGLTMIADIDVRAARRAFRYRYPDDLQQMLRIKEVPLPVAEPLEVTIPSLDLNDHYSGGTIPHHMPLSGSLLRVTSYRTGTDGIENASLTDITRECTVVVASKDAVTVKLPAISSLKNRNTHASVFVIFTHLYPDVFSPHLAEFQRSILQKYSDIRLAGVCKDEWGFPPYYPRFYRLGTHDFWYSQHLAQAYSEHTRGRRILDDFLLMAYGIAGKERERYMAINHLMEMTRQRNVALEDDFYHSVKSVFGPNAAVTVHATWWPYPDRNEFKKNGLDWWAATRDWAQTDEVAPFAVRTALSKKWKSPIWYNMYYKKDLAPQMWSSALAGGRINYLSFQSLSSRDLLHAESRIRLLNYITKSPLDCPVAVIFGHAAAMNWAGPCFNDVGMELVDRLWREGYATDLIPTSEIENGSLRIDTKGRICYGDQKYAAVVLHHPEFENKEMAQFFRKAGHGATALFRVGEWTRDFDGRPVDGGNLLPKSMDDSGDVGKAQARLLAVLEKKQIPKQTPATAVLDNTFFELRDFESKSYAPPATGHSRLIDGTVIHVAGTASVSGDPIVTEMQIRNRIVSINAIGVAAVRLNDRGRLEALAAGGLKHFKSGDFEITLNERTDVALWVDRKGEWQGVLQSEDGLIPEQLMRITKRWTRLRVPVPAEVN
jgi:hypothetical protein